MADSVEYSINRPDRYAPIGVFFDQINQAGEWRFDIHYSSTTKLDLYHKADKISDLAALDEYTYIPTEMNIESTTLSISAAPTDLLTLMIVAPYTSNKISFN